MTQFSGHFLAVGEGECGDIFSFHPAEGVLNTILIQGLLVWISSKVVLALKQPEFNIPVLKVFEHRGASAWRFPPLAMASPIAFAIIATWGSICAPRSGLHDGPCPPPPPCPSLDPSSLGSGLLPPGGSGLGGPWFPPP